MQSMHSIRRSLDRTKLRSGTLRHSVLRLSALTDDSQDEKDVEQRKKLKESMELFFRSSSRRRKDDRDSQPQPRSAANVSTNPREKKERNERPSKQSSNHEPNLFRQLHRKPPSTPKTELRSTRFSDTSKSPTNSKSSLWSSQPQGESKPQKGKFSLSLENLKLSPRRQQGNLQTSPTQDSTIQTKSTTPLPRITLPRAPPKARNTKEPIFRDSESPLWSSMRKKTGLFGVGKESDITSPLSALIQQMEAERKPKPGAEEANREGERKRPQQHQRQSNHQNSLRAMRQQERRAGQEAINNFLQKGQPQAPQQQRQSIRPKHRRRPGKIKLALPNYELSLQEASLLFRRSKEQLLRILRRLGVDTRSGNGELVLDVETLELVASECSNVEVVDENEVNDEVTEEERMTWPSRPPVVTVMGHVDHGKTTLMDALRRRARGDDGKKEISKKSKHSKKEKPAVRGDVAGTEAGGITQVISAFQVSLEEGDASVTFLDTPGHAAFRNMRQSGSEAADIIVLVVAAEDGLAAQSIEILNFYKGLLQQGVDISLVVAMNKIDQPGLNVDECRYNLENQLLEHGILAEGMPQTTGEFFGSPVQLYPISAKAGTGLEDLVEGLALQSEIMDLRAPSEESASGILLDARMEKGLGIVVDAIVKTGSLKVGDYLVSGTHKGKVRILKAPQVLTQLKEALPSQPVHVVGWESLPAAGELFETVESEEMACAMVEKRTALKDKSSEKGTNSSSNVEVQGGGMITMNHDWQKALREKYNVEDGDSAVIRIPVILKASADGTLMALQEALDSLLATSSRRLQLDIAHAGVGGVSENDIELAVESGAIVLAFDVKAPSLVDSKVPVFQSKVIYSLLESAQDAMAEYYLPPTEVEEIHGKATVQAVFSIGGKSETVAGLRVLQGSMHRLKAGGEPVMFRVLDEDGTVKSTGRTSSSLKHFKEDVEEVKSGQECGMSLEGYNEYEEGDVIECFTTVLKRQFL